MNLISDWGGIVSPTTLRGVEKEEEMDDDSPATLSSYNQDTRVVIQPEELAIKQEDEEDDGKATNELCTIVRVETINLDKFNVEGGSGETAKKSSETEELRTLKKKLKHSDEKAFQCDKCHEVFSRKHSLKKHKLSHKRIKPFLCDQCQYSCSSQAILERHASQCKERSTSSKKSDLAWTLTNDKRFDCDKCQIVFSKKKDLIQHKRIHAEEELKFDCDQCDYSCFRKSHLKQHKMTHKADNTIFKCEQCDYTCPKEALMKIHKLTHNGQQAFQCDQCDYICLKKCSLLRHYTKHTQYKAYQCNKCDFQCSRKDHLTRHELTQHVKEKLFQCDDCDYVSSRKDHFIKHRRKHPESSSLLLQALPPPCLCEECGVSFTEKSELEQHKTIHHVVDSLLQCNKCEYSCSTNTALCRHIKTHTDAKQIQCDEYASLYKSNEHLERHKAIHMKENNMEAKLLHCDKCDYSSAWMPDFKSHQMKHIEAPKRYKCDKCEYSCSLARDLDKHSIVHTGEKNYLCNECGRAFSRQHGLKRHMATHSGEKSFQCEECGYACARRDKLKLHKLKHSGEKPFCCDQCGWRCARNDQLKAHKRTHNTENSFHCNECDFSCSKMNEFKKHTTIHTGVTLYLCGECDYSALTRSSVKKHKVIHTGNNYSSVMNVTTGNWSSGPMLA